MAHAPSLIGAAPVNGALNLEQRVEAPNRLQGDRGYGFALLAIASFFLDVGQFEEARRAWAKQNAGVIGAALMRGSNSGSKPL